MKLWAALNDDERREWDELRYDAAYHPSGVARPSHEAKERYRDLLIDAVQAGRAWAQMVLDHAQLTGLGSDIGQWKRTRAVINFAYGSVITTKPAAMAFRRQRPDGGTEYLSKDWDTCTIQDLRNKLAESEAQKAAAHTLGLLCRSLIRLMKSAPKAGTVAEARLANGLNSIEEWFLLEAERRHAA